MIKIENMKDLTNVTYVIENFIMIKKIKDTRIIAK